MRAENIVGAVAVENASGWLSILTTSPREAEGNGRKFQPKPSSEQSRRFEFLKHHDGATILGVELEGCEPSCCHQVKR
jgi:hypothetical protein